MAYRILATGSKNWSNRSIVIRALDKAAEGSAKPDGSDIILVSTGNSTGADPMAEAYAFNHGWAIERYKLDWRKKGRFAKMSRDKTLWEQPIDVVCAFVSDPDRDQYVLALTALAKAAGVPVLKRKGPMATVPRDMM
jgi:hypothetical protein